MGFKIKRNLDGSISKYKARLVAKGFHQQAGLDFSETFSSVVKPTTIRTVITISLAKGWSILQLDINNAFLNGILTEDIYMQQPPGFQQTNQSSTIVCKLHKVIYRPKQAPRAWFHRLHEFLTSAEFIPSKADTSLFLKFTKTSTIFVLVYVDDILITGSSSEEIQALIRQLNNTFSLKDLGDLHYFLGIEVNPISTGLHLSQTRYITDLLTRANMDKAKALPTPMVSNSSLSSRQGTPIPNPQHYRSLVGALQYITITRPDIAFTVNKVSQFSHQPLDTHYKAVKRILRYLKGTLQHGLVLKRSPNLSLTGFSDADWGGDPDDRRSITGYCVFLGANAITWSSKKQTTVSRSSTEAEYRSLANLTTEVIWIQTLLQELRVPLSQKPILWCDNLSTVALSANPVFHSLSKHFELDLHFVRERVIDRRIEVNHVPSYEQVADILTKPLSLDNFLKFRRKLTIEP